MSVINLESAHRFLSELELPKVVRAGLETLDAAPPVDFDALKNQAIVAGSDIVSFVKGVSLERRQDIVNSAFLAQLVANKKVQNRNNIFEWYDVYFDALINLGWVVQEKGFASYEKEAEGLEAHEAILSVASVLLGAAPTALAIVKSTIDAMKSMDKNNPWITIFDRASQSAETARFQISLAEEDEKGCFMISMMAFGIIAKSTITQVLFFKIRSDKVTLKHRSGNITINEEILSGVREKIHTVLLGRTKGFIDSIDI